MEKKHDDICRRYSKPNMSKNSISNNNISKNDFVLRVVNKNNEHHQQRLEYVCVRFEAK